MFGFIKKTISSFFGNLGTRLKNIFSTDAAGTLNFAELEKMLLESDIGTEVSAQLIDKIKIAQTRKILDFEKLKTLLEVELLNILQQCKTADRDPKILMLVGVNGAGKTTFAAKIADTFKRAGKKPLLVAGDTFRAAAVAQINDWASKINLELVQGVEGQDPASVVFLGAQKFVQEGFDHLIIDTAGRLHTKVNLMAELQKIKTVLTKKLGSGQRVATWLVLDAMLGQSSINQAEIFNNATELDGIVLTKCDGPAKGGIIFAVAQKFKLPVIFISNGQSTEDLIRFDAATFVQNFLS